MFCWRVESRGIRLPPYPAGDKNDRTKRVTSPRCSNCSTPQRTASLGWKSLIFQGNWWSKRCFELELIPTRLIFSEDQDYFRPKIFRKILFPAKSNMINNQVEIMMLPYECGSFGRSFVGNRSSQRKFSLLLEKDPWQQPDCELVSWISMSKGWLRNNCPAFLIVLVFQISRKRMKGNKRLAGW